MKFKDTKYGDLTGQTYDGNINIPSSRITSLEGAPKIIKGDFYASFNKLTSLKYCSEIVNGSFYCSINRIKKFEELPKYVENNFYCHDNPLSQDEIDKLVQVKIEGEIIVPDKLKAPTKEDYQLYNKIKDYNKYLKIKHLKDKL